MKYIEKQILLELSQRLKLKDKIMMKVFKRYTYNIYRMGFDDGFYFKE